MPPTDMTMMPAVLDVLAVNGVHFRARLLPPGGDTPRSDPSKAVVEFFDRRYGHTPNGQFTGGYYYVDTLLKDPPHGLALDMGIPEWTIDGVTMQLVCDWLMHESFSYGR